VRNSIQQAYCKSTGKTFSLALSLSLSLPLPLSLVLSRWLEHGQKKGLSRPFSMFTICNFVHLVSCGALSSCAAGSLARPRRFVALVAAGLTAQIVGFEGVNLF
jgi:O-antigen ligase